MAKSALGRGLSALLPTNDDDDDFVPVKGRGKNNADGKPGADAKGESGRAGAERAGGEAAGRADAGGGEIRVALEKMRPGSGQPRKRFDKTELEELAASIKTHGIIQPVIADRDADGTYVIIAGERRCRAAALAGLREVPVIVRNYSEQKRLEVALIENIHRSDLNPIEEAAAYKQLMEQAGLSQDEAAERVGKNRSTVANTLRLLKLPSAMRESLEDGRLSAGHARAILSLSRAADQEKLFAEIEAGGLSVRAAEGRAAELNAGRAGNSGGGSGGKSSGKNGKAAGAKKDPDLKAMEEKFIRTLGTKVVIHGGLKRGRIEIEYYSMDDLDRLYTILGK